MVLKNGGLLENNILLFEDEQKTSLWTGGAFQDNSGQWYKKTTSPVTEADFLYVTVVPNTKVIYQSELNESLFKSVTNTFSDFLVRQQLTEIEVCLEISSGHVGILEVTLLHTLSFKFHFETYSCFKIDRTIYLFMELCEGGSLESGIASQNITS